MAHLDDQWLPHYAELEAGTLTSATSLLNDCASTEAMRRIDGPLHLNLSDLPSLSQLEPVFHSEPALLAALYHDLILKEHIWQNEPVQAKGGPVAIIPKTLHPKIAEHFRGILLLPNAGKRVHALLRSQIMDKLELSRSPGQLGGFPGQQVLYGSHAIRTFGSVCDVFGLISAILFLDLSSAFHHLVLEIVVGSYDGKNHDPVFDTLTRTGMDAEAFRCFAALPGILSDLGVPAPIVRLLRDIHLGT